MQPQNIADILRFLPPPRHFGQGKSKNEDVGVTHEARRQEV